MRYYRIRGIGHALPIDTGSCSTQGGKTGLFAINKGFHSTFWAAYFFGLIKTPYQITGETILKPNTSDHSYSVPFHQGSSYYWNMPAGMWITGDKHLNSISASVDYQSGTIEVTEINTLGCMLEPCNLMVEIKE